MPRWLQALPQPPLPQARLLPRRRQGGATSTGRSKRSHVSLGQLWGGELRLMVDLRGVWTCLCTRQRLVCCCFHAGLNRKIEAMIKPYTSKYAGAGHSVLLCGQSAVQATDTVLAISSTPAQRRAMPPFPLGRGRLHDLQGLLPHGPAHGGVQRGAGQAAQLGGEAGVGAAQGRAVGPGVKGRQLKY